MSKAKEMILADAIEANIRAERQIIRLKRWICILSALVIGMSILLWCR